uniref:Uncharacterized protein n=1 Tax=Melopsittacus undulatus TaxID=13146 RepID=A0A8V5GZC9_MELUD
MLGGLLSGGGGGGAGGAMRVLGGVISPPRTHISTVDANESEEVRQFRRLFLQLAGDVSATSTAQFIPVHPNPDLKTDGFGLDTCRSMVAVMDSDTTGKLGFEEFKYLWNNIKKWQGIYKQFDTDRSGTIGVQELPGAFEAVSGCPPRSGGVLGRRYGDEGGNLDFDNFISCLVRLDAMFRAFKSLDRDGSGQIRVSLQEVGLGSLWSPLWPHWDPYRGIPIGGSL